MGRTSRQEQGLSSIFILLMVTVLSVLGAGLLTLTNTESQTADSYREGIAAQYIAEAGANQAMAQLSRYPFWTGNGGFQPYDSAHPERGSHKTDIIAGIGAQRTITTIGQVGKSRRQVVIQVRTASPGGGPPAYAFDYVGFNAGVQKLGSASIAGLTGMASQSIPVPTVGLAVGSFVPTFDRLTYRTKGTVVSSLSGVLPQGAYYVAGNLTLDTSISGNAVIYAAGNININAKISGNFLLLAEGNISVGSNYNQEEQLRIASAVLVAGGSITVAGDAHLSGALIAGRDLTAGNSSTLVYDAAPVAYFSLPNSRLPNEFEVLSWSNH